VLLFVNILTARRCASAVHAMACVRLSQARISSTSFRLKGDLRLTLHCTATQFGVSKIRVGLLLPSGTLSQTLDFDKFHRVRPTTVASLSHWTSTFVYNMVGVTQRVARVRLRQLSDL